MYPHRPQHDLLTNLEDHCWFLDQSIDGPRVGVKFLDFLRPECAEIVTLVVV